MLIRAPKAFGVGSSPRRGAKKTIRNDGLFFLKIPNSSIRIAYLTAKNARFLSKGRKIYNLVISTEERNHTRNSTKHI